MSTHHRRSGRAMTALVVIVALLAAGSGCSPAPALPKAEGSGCSGLTNTLPAGTWYGAVKSSSTSQKLSFDVVCLYFGADATAAAIEDGGDPTDTNEVHIRNQSAKIRNVPVCTGANAFALRSGDLGSNKQLTVSNYLKHAKGTLNDPDLFPYGPLTKLTVSPNGGCASVMSQLYLP